MNFPINESVLLSITVYAGVMLSFFWLALIIWAYRDMRARSRDPIGQILVALMVAVLNIPGVFVYILLRPRETLSEAYERSLEEEALLQEIEEKPTCPGCGQRVDSDWQACPYCHTRLKKTCHNCHKLLELSWNLCPHCATTQVSEQVVRSSRHVQPVTQSQPPPEIPQQWLADSYPQSKSETSSSQSSQLEFVDSDDY